MTRMHRCGVRKGRGFTLVEVLIVVAIVAILASVAYPTYLDRRSAAPRIAPEPPG